MNLLLMAVATILLLGGAGLVARRWSRGFADRFWLGLAAVAIQVGVVYQAASLVGQFTPAGVLVGTAACFLLILLVQRLGRTHVPSAANLAPEAPGGPAWARQSLAAIVVVIVLCSGVRRLHEPIWGWDERNYHGPRMMYWLQNQSILPFATHNERQTLFPAGAEMLSVWPLVFERSELPARMVFWLCLPLSCIGLWTVCRAVGVGRLASWGALLLWVSAPAVLARAESFKSDIWLPVFLLGAAYWVVRPRTVEEPRWRAWVMAGIFLGLAVNIKTTAAGVLPAVALAWMFAGGPLRERLRMGVGLAAGGIIAAVLSGAAVIFGYAIVRYGHPLGPPELRALVKPEFGLGLWRIQTARALLFLIEFPEVFSEPARIWLQERVARLAEFSGANTILPGEERLRYPGRFEYRLHASPRNYSLGGLLWPAALLLGLMRTVRLHLLRRRALSGVVVITLMAASLAASVVLGMRWMGGGPGRFWLGAYALSLPVIVFFVQLWLYHARVLAPIVCLAALWAAYPAVKSAWQSTEQAIKSPPTAAQINEPFALAVEHIPPGSRILLIAGNTVREWGLFDPRGGFSNRVISWAEADFDPEAILRLIDREEVTHVLFEQDHRLNPRWSGSIHPGPLLNAIRQRGDFVEVQGVDDGARLFAQRRSR